MLKKLFRPGPGNRGKPGRPSAEAWAPEEVRAVADFFRNYPGFRLTSTCAQVTGLDEALCQRIKAHLVETRQMGIYTFGPEPQRFMREEILRVFPDITPASAILEVGPGAHPLFPSDTYRNWTGVDKYYEEGKIRFKNLEWENANPNILNGSFETLSGIEALHPHAGRFDLVCGCHSYEHVFRPIGSLIECRKMLRPGGGLALFVPDGFSDEPASRNEMTHTLYLVPDMIQEFFHYAGGYCDLQVKTFRPNADYMITARTRPD